MNSMTRGALIGGVIGAAVAAVRTSRRSRPGDADAPSTASAALRGALGGSLLGGLVGLAGDRRARETAIEWTDEGLAHGRELADRARPHVDAALDSASEQLHDVGDVVTTTVVPSVVAAAWRAADVVGDAVEASRPHLHDAYVSGRAGVAEAVEAARPAVESAAAEARQRAAAFAA